MSIEENQPRIRLPFFTKEVMEANFDLPVFTGDKFRHGLQSIYYYLDVAPDFHILC